MEHGICRQVLVGVGNLKAQIKRLKVETFNRKKISHDELWFKAHEDRTQDLHISRMVDKMVKSRNMDWAIEK